MFAITGFAYLSGSGLTGADARPADFSLAGFCTGARR